MSRGNFHYEQRRLENDLVVLEPFDPTVHAGPFVDAIKTHPDILTYISFPVVETEEDFMTEVYDKHIAPSPGECLYAIIDKAPAPASASGGGRKDAHAGTIALTNTDPGNAVTEIGILIFPAFQRTHVATNAIGLLLQYTLDPPSAGGLGLRRVEWKCHAGNAASRRIAGRMGFEFEGVAKWHRVFPGGAVALPVEALEKRNGTRGELPGRHTASFSIVWDEWDEKRPKVVAQMERKQ